MFPPIYKVCSADAGVVAILGADPTRLYPFGEAPQKTSGTYAVWQDVGGSPANFLNQRPVEDVFALQIDAYADTASAARQAAEALRDAIEPHAQITRWGGEGRDSSTKRYRYSFDVDWFVSR